MNLTDPDNPALSAASSGPAPTGRLGRAWQRYQNSGIPLGVKWSLSIAALIVVTMGMLGSYLIRQQEATQRMQADRYSRIIVDQLARSSSEPVMAGDALALRLLLQRQVDNPLILGAELVDLNGDALAAAGVTPPHVIQRERSAWAGRHQAWQSDGFSAVTYVRALRYQDVTAGYLSLTFDRSPLERELAQTLRALVVSSLLMVVIGVLLASLLAHRLSRPIERLARAGEALADVEPGSEPHRRDEIGRVLETFRQLAEGMRHKRQTESALSRYVSPRVAQQVLANLDNLALGGNSVQGSVLFCDIVGFTRLSETRDPAAVAALLNDYFGFIALAAQSCGGTVDKFIGDCIMVVFGVPDADAHHALHAVTCGMLVQQLTQRVNRIRAEADKPTVQFRVGISSGAMLAGNLGSHDRMQFTVVGDTVNIAARLCGLAEPGGVLINGATVAGGAPGSSRHYHQLGPITLRGRAAQVGVVAMDVGAVAHATDADRMIDDILLTARVA